jgi:hypothetical protein
MTPCTKTEFSDENGMYNNIKNEEEKKNFINIS